MTPFWKYYDFDPIYEIYKHLNLQWTEIGVWQAYLLSKATALLPVVWHGGYGRKTFLFCREDKTKVPPFFRRVEIPDVEDDLSPKVRIEGNVATVSCCFWNDWRGLYRETEKIILKGTKLEFAGKSEIDKFHMIDLAGNTLSEKGNLSFLNAYNYTLFAPTDAAMDIAYSNGLPSWADFEATVNSDPDLAKQMVCTMRDFVYYHVINGTVYADNTIAAGNYSTFYSDKNSVIQKLKISGGGGTLDVQEIYIDGTGIQYGPTHSVQEGSATANIMSRDIYLDDIRKQATKMTASSFITIHGINTPLCFNKTGQY